MWNAMKKAFVKQQQQEVPFQMEEEELNLVRARMHSTRDIAHLEESAYQRVFICDQMMKHHSFNDFIESELKDRFLGHGFTRNNYTYLRRKLGKYSHGIPLNISFGKEYQPWRKSDMFNIPFCKIKGELYEIPTAEMNNIDNMYNNGLEFWRERVSIVVPYRDVIQVKDVSAFKGKRLILSEYKAMFVRAWMYFGIPQYWEPMLDAGMFFQPVETFQPKYPVCVGPDNAQIAINIDRYYEFTTEAFKIE